MIANLFFMNSDATCDIHLLNLYNRFYNAYIIFYKWHFFNCMWKLKIYIYIYATIL